MSGAGRASPRREWAAVALGFTVLAAVVGVWLALDHRPPEWDHANHLERAVLCAADLAAGDVRAILERSSFYTPLVHCLAAMAYRIAPSDVAAAQSVVVAFLGLGMAMVYLLGRALAGGRAGVLAAWIFGSAPFIVFSALRFQVDLPLAAMVAAALVLLLRTGRFEHRGWSLLAGLVAGAGMLTKPTFALYVLPPALVLLLGARERRAVVNAALATAVAVAVVLPWFGPRLFGLPAQLGARGFAQAAESGHPDPLSWAGLGFYAKTVWYQLGVLATLSLLAGLALAALRRQWFLLAAVIVPLGPLLLVQNKNLRYSLPLLGAAAVVAALPLAALRGRLGLAAGAVVVGVGLAQVTATAFGVPPSVRLPALGVPWVLASPPSSADWRHRAVLARIAHEGGGPGSTVSVVPNHNFFSVSNFRYYGLRDGRPLRFVRAWDDPPLGIDYMILKTGDVGPPWTAGKSHRAMARLDDPHLARVFPVIGEFPLPDGSLATVRARRLGAGVDAAPATVARAIEDGVRRRLGEVVRHPVNLRLALVHDASIGGGRVARLEITADAVTVAEFTRPGAAQLRLHDVRVVLEDLLVNPYSALADGRFDPLDVGHLRLEAATIAAEDLRSFLAGLRRFRGARIELLPGAVAVALEQRGPDVRARVRVAPAADRPFALVAEDVRVGVLPVPAPLVNWVIRHYDPTPRLAGRVPFPVTIGRVVVTEEAVRIGSDR